MSDRPDAEVRAAEREAYEQRHAAWLAETHRQLTALARRWGMTPAKPFPEQQGVCKRPFGEVAND